MAIFAPNVVEFQLKGSSAYGVLLALSVYFLWMARNENLFVGGRILMLIYLLCLLLLLSQKNVKAVNEDLKLCSKKKSSNLKAGLRLLLCPLGSNIVIRTACCSVGIALPVYSTFKAIETKDQDEQQKWLLYWTAYGSFTVAELFTNKFLYWCPLYYHMKFAFLVWLQLPFVDGARQLYVNHLGPFLRRHQPRLDRLVGFLYGEIAKFVSNHESEFQFAKSIISKILLTANDVVMEIVQPGQREGSGKAIEASPYDKDTSESENED